MYENITGQRIWALRHEHDMTQEQLGNMLNITKAAVNKYEKGTLANISREAVLTR